MSGHSKWAGIKHQKAITDARRSQAFTKLASALTMAAKAGGGDPDTNFRLRLAIAKAREANMPMSNIDRAVARGVGGGSGANMEEVLYEGYGPAGSAFLVEVATDNRNRAASAVRAAFSKHGGHQAEAGSVSYQFEQKGVIQVPTKDIDQASLDAIESGASDIEETDEGICVYTLPTQLEAVRASLAEAGYQTASVELAYIPKSPLLVDDPKDAANIIKLADILEDLDDVAAVHANFELTGDALASQS